MAIGDEMNERPDNVAVEGRSATPQGRSPTPRTDKVIAAVDANWSSVRGWDILREHARQLECELAAKQAEIDRLMLEHCPDEMTPEQIANWERHQKPAQLDDQYDADATYG